MPYEDMIDGEFTFNNIEKALDSSARREVS